jgi:hypothetical protein
MSGIPTDIMANAEIIDIEGLSHAHPVCNSCGENFGHHYACPEATEQRRQDRINTSNLHHEYILFEPEMMQ